MKSSRTALVSALVIIALIVAAWLASLKSSRTLNVLNWDFYIGSDTIRNFEKEFGIKVRYELYKDNEECYAKVKSKPGLYDVIFPSDHMIQTMIDQNLLSKIDKTRITNLENIGKDYRSTYFDPNEEYNVPYMFGTTGFAIDTNAIPNTSLSWRQLVDPKFRMRIAVIDDMRYVLGSVLIELGKSPNTKLKADLDEAVALLRQIKPNIRKFSADTPKDLIASGDVWVTYAWSGDILQVQKANPKLTLEYQIPSAGGLRFQDGICIPIGAPHYDDAHLFINYLLRPDVSGAITNDIFYGNTNTRALEFIRDEIKRNPASFPNEEVLRKCQWIQDVGAALKLYEAAWEEVKR